MNPGQNQNKVTSTAETEKGVAFLLLEDALSSMNLNQEDIKQRFITAEMMENEKSRLEGEKSHDGKHGSEGTGTEKDISRRLRLAQQAQGVHSELARSIRPEEVQICPNTTWRRLDVRGTPTGVFHA